MLLWITHSIYAMSSLIIQKYFIEIYFYRDVTDFNQNHPPPNLPSRRITKNMCTYLPPGRDVIIESPLAR